jgi:hypothetical protein
MSKPGNSIQGDGHNRRAVGVSRRWSGSTRHPIQRTLKPLVWLWPLDQRQRRHLSWQSPELRRKDKALAEAAALLMASKKIQAYWGEDGED